MYAASSPTWPAAALALAVCVSSAILVAVVALLIGFRSQRPTRAAAVLGVVVVFMALAVVPHIVFCNLRRRSQAMYRVFTAFAPPHQAGASARR